MILQCDALSLSQMMTDRFFVYPSDQAAKDHCSYLTKHYCYRYEMAYSGRKSFLDILHKESPDEAVSSLFGEWWDQCFILHQCHIFKIKYLVIHACPLLNNFKIYCITEKNVRRINLLYGVT